MPISVAERLVNRLEIALIQLDVGERVLSLIIRALSLASRAS